MFGKSKSFIIIGATAAQAHRVLNMPCNKLRWNYTDRRWNYTDTSHLLEKRSKRGRNEDTKTLSLERAMYDTERSFFSVSYAK